MGDRISVSGATGAEAISISAAEIDIAAALLALDSDIRCPNTRGGLYNTRP